MTLREFMESSFAECFVKCYEDWVREQEEDDIFESYDFYGFYDWCRYNVEDFESYFVPILQVVCPEAETCTGVSKLVLVSSDEAEAVKIVFREDVSKMSETEIYCRAEDEGFEKFFPRTSEISYVRVAYEDKLIYFPYYFQEYVTSSSDDNMLRHRLCNEDTVFCSEIKKSFSKSYREALSNSSDWMGGRTGFFFALEYFDCPKREEFVKFLVDQGINDLHSGNWRISNGKVKLIDFSGCYWD